MLTLTPYTITEMLFSEGRPGEKVNYASRHRQNLEKRIDAINAHFGEKRLRDGLLDEYIKQGFFKLLDHSTVSLERKVGRPIYITESGLLVGDSKDELHKFAALIGLNKRAFGVNENGVVGYVLRKEADVKRALSNGATKVSEGLAAEISKTCLHETILYQSEPKKMAA